MDKLHFLVWAETVFSPKRLVYILFSFESAARVFTPVKSSETSFYIGGSGGDLCACSSRFYDFHIFILELSLLSSRGEKRLNVCPRVGLKGRFSDALQRLFYLKRTTCDVFAWRVTWSLLLLFFCLSLFACRSAFLKALFSKLEFTRRVSAFNETSETSCRCDESILCMQEYVIVLLVSTCTDEIIFCEVDIFIL